MAYTINNNFKNLKADFMADTGKNADDNIELYIQYFNARMSDKIMQYNHIIATELVNGFAHLPNAMRMEMADMVRSLKKGNVI